MNNFISLLVFGLFCTNVFSQSLPLIGYDLLTNETDTIFLETMPDLTADKTTFYVGDYDQSIAELPNELDVDNLFDDSQWTIKKPADLDFNSHDFPIRTSVKMFRISQDTLYDICSGSMIGSRYMLSAGHCVTDNQENIIFNDVLVCPIYNNGLVNEIFECSKAEKIYFFEDWRVGNEDFGIYVLADALGQKTGWLGIGFDENETFKEDLLHKFSYPNLSLFNEWEYNGDTLYHSFGYADIFEVDDIGVSGARGMPGESGSSLIQIIEEDIYTSYGVSTYSYNMLHSRIQKKHFYSIRELINSQDISSTKNSAINLEWKIFPNPASDYLKYSTGSVENDEALIRIYSIAGKLIKSMKIHQDELIDVSNLIEGAYLIRIEIKNVEKTFQFMKSN